MNSRVNAVAANVFVPIHSRDAVLEQLKLLYTAEIICVIKAIDKLLPHYRTLVNDDTYERERAKAMVVAAFVYEGTMGKGASTTSLNYVLNQQKRLIGVLQHSIHSEKGGFRSQCQNTGLVKAYKKMSKREAGKRNLQLTNDVSTCRWIVDPVTGPAPNDL